MSSIAGDLGNQIVSFDINPDATARLAAIYHRSIARRLWESADIAGAARGREDGWKDVVWLPPRSVWAARKGLSQAERRAAVTPEVIADLVHPTPQPPAVSHVPQDITEAWSRESIRMLESDIKTVDQAQALRLSEPLARSSRQSFHAAVEMLQKVWPEAAAEYRTLIRAVVYVEGGLFRSATIQRAFGAIYASAAYLASVPIIFELLLHETGHHSLYMRNAFVKFIVNDTEIAAHPMRSDPRPLSGVMHSAHALARMGLGLDRWSALDPAQEEVRSRRDDAVGQLTQTLDILETKAQWTEHGRKYFDELRACERKLLASSAPPALADRVSAS